jgi:hypothetical protein
MPAAKFPILAVALAACLTGAAAPKPDATDAAVQKVVAMAGV